MSATNLAQHEQYLKSLEDCLQEISNHHLEMRAYMDISQKHLHTMQAHMWDVDETINKCQAGAFMLKTLVSELKSTLLNFKEQIL